MVARTDDAQKVTVSLPARLLEYANQRAASLGTSRSAVVASALAELQDRELEKLASEGYAFYSSEATAFAAASLTAVSETLENG